MYVFDATPLIYLGTVDRLDLLGTLTEDCVIPERVHDEVVAAGIAEGHSDARRVERAVEQGLLRREDVIETAESAFDRLRSNPRISDADAAVLAIADKHDGVAVMDEDYGRAIADAEGIPTHGTAYLVLSCIQGAITAEEARTTIDAMLEAGWYCAPDPYAKLRHQIDELR